LARASLANVSPTLLADPKDWNNLYYALGFTPTATKFIPRSIDMKTVMERLRDIVPGFNSSLEGFAFTHMSRRNEELHSGNTPFNGLTTSKWLPSFYEVCDVLVRSMGGTLELFLGSKEAAEIAEKMIAAARDDAAKSVERTIKGHREAFLKKDEDEQQDLLDQAAVWATRHDGHRVKCPACSADAILSGDPIAAPIQHLEDDHIIEKQDYLPSKFECVACGLKISGFPQLTASGLGDTYTATFTYDAVEYYGQMMEPQYEEDFNC